MENWRVKKSSGGEEKNSKVVIAGRPDKKWPVKIRPINMFTSILAGRCWSLSSFPATEEFALIRNSEKNSETKNSKLHKLKRS
jgi:hypothetical protein